MSFRTRFFRFLIGVFGALLGLALTMLIFETLLYFNILNPFTDLYHWVSVAIYVVAALVFGLVFLAFSGRILSGIASVRAKLETKMRSMPAEDMVIGTVGLITGLIVAFLITTLFRGIISSIRWLEFSVGLVVYLVLGDLGWNLAVKRRREIANFIFRRSGGREKEEEDRAARNTPHKILDTNVVIDGRILDICKTGFVEGTLVVPAFVLQELRHIADSPDVLKRNRGRRGLDVLNSLQKEPDLRVVVEETDYDDIREVDNKILKLAQDLGGVVVTNDFNLNKVAAVQGIQVLNINELANAVKPVALPGEEMRVKVVKEGKETGQGLAYLEDGTMIVVEGGRSLLGAETDVVVTSVLQTAAGRMIFARLS
ncbi:MAG: PIN/TRAM domain-containing protein [Christensenellales bacterium]|jgi:uncharacterized protein YacL